jgi:periplasmic protein TonB
MRKESLAVSLALHLSLIGALALLSYTAASGTSKPTSPATRQITRLTLPPPPPRAVRRTSLSDPGGGDRSPLPPSKGAPPRSEARVFIPPQIVRNENPKLTLQAGFDDVPKLNLPVGDLSGKSGVPSLGPGLNGTGGYGNQGVGPGPGSPGPQGTAGIVVRPSKWPELLHKIEPEYSESARKVKQQGTVILAVEVGTDGRPHNIRIVRGLGLGLDEKAIDAVNSWRFRPALQNGRPVAAPITIEVNFRLL